jgi:hypothetical protein
LEPTLRNNNNTQAKLAEVALNNLSTTTRGARDITKDYRQDIELSLERLAKERVQCLKKASGYLARIKALDKEIQELNSLQAKL